MGTESLEEKVRGSVPLRFWLAESAATDSTSFTNFAAHIVVSLYVGYIWEGTWTGSANGIPTQLDDDDLCMESE